MPLSELLRRAMNQRIAAQRRMKTKRTDHAEIFGSIGMVRSFIASYPVATDERVRNWCRENRGHVARACIGGTKTLQKLTV